MSIDLYEYHKQIAVAAISASDVAKRRIPEVAKEKADAENRIRDFRLEHSARETDFRNDILALRAEFDKEEKEKCRRESDYIELQRALKERSRKAAADLKTALRTEKEAIAELRKHPKHYNPEEIS